MCGVEKVEFYEFLNSVLSKGGWTATGQCLFDCSERKLNWSFGENNKTGNVQYLQITLKHVRITNAAVEKQQVLHILSWFI